MSARATDPSRAPSPSALGKASRVTSAAPASPLAPPAPAAGTLVHARASRRNRRRFSLGLRARVTVAFAAAGLLVAVLLSVITYTLARNYLIEQREDVARRQAFVNARLVRDVLRNPLADVGQLMSSVRTEGGGFALLNVDERWYAQNVAFGQNAIPNDLREATLNGQTGRQTFSRRGQPYLAVGVHVAESDAAYFEVFPLGTLDRTLGVIGTSLVIGAAVTTAIAAALGWWASRRLLRPLSRVADAAAELASGDFDTRLEEEQDPDLHLLVTSFNEMADAVQSRIEREARFASDVSHELRSPITALTAAVEVLDARREDLTPRSRQALDVVVNQVRRFDQMVLDLLELSRLDAGAMELRPEPVLLGELTRRIAVRYGAESVPIDIDPSIANLPVEVDKRRFERIVANLLVNAQQHAGGATCIAIGRGGPGHVRLVVEDAGPGVPPAERHRVFERFARGSAGRAGMGTGLGLALVSEHVSLHGGRVWVEDRAGGGSRFVVELPQHQPMDHEPA